MGEQTAGVSAEMSPVATWHELKVQPPYFEEVFEGRKTFEVRKNDRAYQRGDLLRLREWDYDSGLTELSRYTGRECVRRVTFVYSGDPRFGGVAPGFVVLALANDGGEA